MTDGPYERLCIYHPREVLPFVCRGKKKYAGKEIKMGSSRYITFARKGTTCKYCGLVGAYFALERHKNGNTDKFHFNLYGINEEGEETMLTKDHIIPRSKGGSNKLGNLQVLCEKCNSKKGDKILIDFGIGNRILKRVK